MASRADKFLEMNETTPKIEKPSRADTFMATEPPKPKKRLTVEQFRERAQSPTAAFLGEPADVRQIKAEDVDIPRSLDYAVNAYRRGMASADQDAARREGRIGKPIVEEYTPTEKWKRAWAEGDASGMVTNIPGMIGQLARGGQPAPSFTQAERELQNLPSSPAKEAYEGGKLTNLLRPGVALEMILESLPPMLRSQAEYIPKSAAKWGATGATVGVAGGAPAGGIGALPGAAIGGKVGLAYGAALGIGDASYATEFGSSVIDQMRQIEGLNLTDENAVRATLANPTIMEPIYRRADAKARKIQFYDTLAAGLGGNVSSLVKGAGKSALRKVGAEAAEVGSQAVLGSVGELRGEQAAGEKLNAPAILAEGGIEVAQTAATSALNRALGLRGTGIRPSGPSDGGTPSKVRGIVAPQPKPAPDVQLAPPEPGANPLEPSPITSAPARKPVVEEPAKAAPTDDPIARATDPNTPPEELTAMVGTSTEIDRALLENTNLPDEAIYKMIYGPSETEEAKSEIPVAPTKPIERDSKVRGIVESPQPAEVPPQAPQAPAMAVPEPVARLDWADEFESVGGKIDPDGTVLLYHATTIDGADSISKSGVLKRPDDAPDSYGVYLSSSPDVANDYGDGTLVAVRVKASDLAPDDVFPGRRMDFSIPTRRGKYKPVSAEIVKAQIAEPPQKGVIQPQAETKGGDLRGKAEAQADEADQAGRQEGLLAPPSPEIGPAQPAVEPAAEKAATRPEQALKPVSRLEGKGIEYVSPDTLDAAKADWNANRLYVDNSGNWRVRKQGQQKGPIASYNKELKKRGITSDDLQRVSKPAAEVAPPEPAKPVAKKAPPAPEPPVAKQPPAEAPAKQASDAKVSTIAGKMDLTEFERMGYDPSEVTQSDWVNLQRAERRRLGQDEASGTQYAPYGDYKAYHRRAVEEALRKGEEVDPRVLADYPDLAPKAEAPAEKPTEKAKADIYETTVNRGGVVQPAFAVKAPKRLGFKPGNGDQLFSTRAEAEKALEFQNRQEAELTAKEDRARAEKEYEKTRPRTSVERFTDGMIPTRRAKAKAALDVSMLREGMPRTRAEIVERAIADGATVVPHPTMKRLLKDPSGAFVEEGRLTKTAMDYAEFILSEKQGQSPNAVAPAESHAEIRAIIRHVGDIGDLTGDKHLKTRQRILELATGKKFAKSEAGINAVRKELFRIAEVTDDTLAGKHRQVNAWAADSSRASAGPTAPMDARHAELAAKDKAYQDVAKDFPKYEEEPVGFQNPAEIPTPPWAARARRTLAEGNPIRDAWQAAWDKHTKRMEMLQAKLEETRNKSDKARKGSKAYKERVAEIDRLREEIVKEKESAEAARIPLREAKLEDRLAAINPIYAARAASELNIRGSYEYARDLLSAEAQRQGMSKSDADALAIETYSWTLHEADTSLQDVVREGRERFDLDKRASSVDDILSPLQDLSWEDRRIAKKELYAAAKSPEDFENARKKWEETNSARAQEAQEADRIAKVKKEAREKITATYPSPEVGISVKQERSHYERQIDNALAEINKVRDAGEEPSGTVEFKTPTGVFRVLNDEKTLSKFRESMKRMTTRASAAREPMNDAGRADLIDTANKAAKESGLRVSIVDKTGEEGIVTEAEAARYPIESGVVAGMPKRASFNPRTGEVTLYKGATLQDALHEIGHAGFDLLSKGERDIAEKAGLTNEEDFVRAAAKFALENRRPRSPLHRAFLKVINFMRRVATQMGLRDAQIEDVFRNIYEGRVAKQGELVSNTDELRASAVEPSETIGIAYKRVDRELLAMGLPESKHGPKMTEAQLWDDAGQAIRDNPNIAQQLVWDLAAEMRPMTSLEDAVMTREMIRIANERADAQEAFNRASQSGDGRAKLVAAARVENARALYQQLADTTTQAGTANAQALRFRQLLAKRDYSLAAVERTLEVANDGQPLDEKGRAEAERLSKELLAAQKRVEELTVQNAELEKKNATLAAEAEATKKETPKERHEKRTENPRERAKLKELKKRPQETASVAAWLDSLPDVEETRASAPEPPKDKFTASRRLEDPKLASQLAMIGKDYLSDGFTDFDDWSAQMKAHWGEKGSRLSPFLRGIWEDIQSEAQPAKREKIVKRAQTKMEDGETPDYLHKVAIRLYRSFYEEGMRDREEILNAMVPEMQQIVPEIDRNGVGDAFSGIGIYKELSKAEVEVSRRKAAAVELEQAKRRRIEAGVAPPPTGVQRQAPDAEIRAEIKLTNEAKRQHPEAIAVDPERQLKSSLQAIETRIDNEIEDVTRDLARGEKAVKTRTTPEWTAAMKEKKQWLDELRGYRDMAFGREGPTEEQILARTEKMYERLIAKKRRQIAEGDLFPTKKTKGPVNARIEAQKSELAALSAELDLLKAASDVTRQKKIDAAIAARDRLAERIAEGRTATRPKPAGTPIPEVEAINAERKELAKVLAQLRTAEKRSKNPVTPEQLADKKRLANMQRRIATLDAKIAAYEGDYYNAPKPNEKRPLNAELTKAEFDLSEKNKEYLRAQEAYRRRHRSPLRKAYETVGEAIDLGQAVLTSMDVSAVGRQGIFIAAGDPLLSARQIPAMFKAMRSKEGQFVVDQMIQNDPDYQLAKQAGVFFAGHEGALSQMEEATMSRHAQKIPLVGGSQRAYETFLNKIGFEFFKALLAEARRDGPVTLEEAKQLALFVNEAKGRGSLHGRADDVLVGLNRIIFAPRLVVSRFQMLAGHGMWEGTGRTRKIVAKRYARALLGLALMYGASAALKKSLGEPPDKWDLRSSDAGKIRVGKTRIDPLGGFLQTAVFLTRYITEQSKNEQGKIVPLTGDKMPYGGLTLEDVIWRFQRSKFRPVVGTVFIDAKKGQTFTGEWMTAPQAASQLLVPMTIRDTYDAIRSEGVPKGMALGLLSAFGVGINTYADKKPKGKQPPFWSWPGNPIPEKKSRVERFLGENPE